MSSDYVNTRVASQRRVRRRRPWLDAAQTPFRDDAPMVGPPRTTAADFKMPRLRRCLFDLDGMVWEARMDGGMDGYVWKVRFGAQGPYVLKVFWDAKPVDFPTYYAPQRECQNAALLQMMQTAVEQAAAASRPIFVNAKPTTWDDAIANLAVFSDEARLEQPSAADRGSEPPPGLRKISTMPRMKSCYGWLTIPGKVFQELRLSLRPPPVQVDRIKRYLAPDQEYIAIVYEYVEEGENHPDTMQKAMDFFWLAGFSRTFSPLSGNWKSGVLVDLSDIVPPYGYGWEAKLYENGPGSAHILLKQLSRINKTRSRDYDRFLQKPRGESRSSKVCARLYWRKRKAYLVGVGRWTENTIGAQLQELEEEAAAPRFGVFGTSLLRGEAWQEEPYCQSV
ncbi:hypothetical protein OQA88_11134 [Cercophora sp. LCS_1]